MSETSKLEINWFCLPMDEIPSVKLFELLKLRQDIFQLEQNCLYPELDELDRQALHVFGIEKSTQQVVAVSRIIEPGRKYREAAIGRVAVHPSYRKHGVGKGLMLQTMNEVFKHFNSSEIRISAQQYLENFYISLGFEPTGKEYLEDGIPHLEMIKK